MKFLNSRVLKYLRHVSHTSVRRCSTAQRPKFCVVGSGPAGFYTAQGLLKQFPEAAVDMYEKFPVPFGLIRFGVAPDHPEVKNAIATFTKTANKNGFTLLGNVNIGRDISIEELLDAYHAVILCTGAEDDKRLGIPGEDLNNIVSARSMVGWYCGNPDQAEWTELNLDVETVAVLGHGNVALDVARMLLTSVDDLKNTDITEYALEALSRSRIRNVVLVGRRGPLQAAFTIKEFREMTNLKDVEKVIHLPSEVDLSESVVAGLTRAKKRLTELMLRTANNTYPSAQKRFIVKFLRSPQQFLPNSDGSRVAGVRFSVNKLEEDHCFSTGEYEDLECQLVLKSVGYRGLQIDPSIPFDANRGIISNKIGRIFDRPGIYCGGWAATGPVGVIAATLDNSFQLSRIIASDVKYNDIDVTKEKPGKDYILDILNKKKVQVVSFQDWLKIDQEEISRGEKVGKPREKITRIEEMLRIAR